MNKDLIFGKSRQERIVGMEDVGNGTMELFIQNPDGTITTKTELHNYWILTDQAADQHSVRLKGDGYYKWRNDFSLRDDFDFAKKQMYKVKHKCFWINDSKESYMVQNGHSYFKGMKHNEVSVLSFDIETVGLDLNKDSKVLIISNTFRDHKGNITRKLFNYDEFQTSKEMLLAWCDWVCEMDPSFFVGHNIYSYDLSYLDHCASLANIELKLGRKGKAIKFNNYSSKFRKDGSSFIEYKKCYIYGREIVDTFFLSYRFDLERKYENYRLKSIIAYEGLEVEGRQHYDGAKISTNYKIPSEWVKIKKYALHDADDALALYDLMSAPYFYMTQSVAKSYQEMFTSASGSQLNSIMIRSYLQDGYSLPKTSEAKSFEGAISFGNPGIFRNINKIDISSLYPSILIAYEIYDSAKDPHGNFKEMVKTFTKQRLEYKKQAKNDKYASDRSAALKIFINSCYGFLGANGLLFNSPKNAALVTEKGREILNKSLDWAKNKGFIIANGDTDSISYCKSDMSAISKEECEQHLKEVNSLFPETIKFETDGYFSVFVVLKAKNYIMYSADKKLKIKGSALKSSKIEIALKSFLNDIIDAIIQDKSSEEMKCLYDNYAIDATNVKDIKKWSSKKSITEKVYSSERANETKIKDAIEGTEYQIADKVYLYFKEDGTLSLAERFDGNYDRKKLLAKLFKTSMIFANVLPVKDLFPNYALKKNKKTLETLVSIIDQTKHVS